VGKAACRCERTLIAPPGTRRSLSRVSIRSLVRPASGDGIEMATVSEMVRRLLSSLPLSRKSHVSLLSVRRLVCACQLNRAELAVPVQH
jgi:hypothetical protein